MTAVTGPRQLAIIEPSVGHAGGGEKSEENDEDGELELGQALARSLALEEEQKMSWALMMTERARNDDTCWR